MSLYLGKNRIGSGSSSLDISSIYPVGSVYLTTSTSETCPIASLISGSTWEKLGTELMQSIDSSLPIIIWKRLT